MTQITETILNDLGFEYHHGDEEWRKAMQGRKGYLPVELHYTPLAGGVLWIVQRGPAQDTIEVPCESLERLALFLKAFGE